MGLLLAFKAFFKALRNPKKALEFINESESQVVINENPSLKEGDFSHLRLLNSLQQSGRFIDFIKEDLSSFNDAQIGAVVRKIHQDCSSTLEELIAIRPLKDEPEGAVVQIPKGYNPAEIKIVGKVTGEPPFKGVVMHRGWKAQKRSLPKRTVDAVYDNVIYPAEIEIRS